MTRDPEFFHRLAPVSLSCWGTFRNTLACVRQAIRDGVPGDLVECGVFAGVHPALMALALTELGVTDRRVHLFDSFAGIPESGPKDDATITSCVGVGQDRLVSTGVSVCTLEQVKANLHRWGVDESLLIYHPGWFQDTISRAHLGAIAVLRLDCDLYSSTMACLPHLYPKLSCGGWYISDDYTLTGAKTATDEYLASVGEHPMPLKVIEGDGCHYWQRA